MTCLLLVKELSFKYDIWISWFMKMIENSIHYHNVLKFEELETVLTAEEAWMNSDSVVKKANIMWAVKERFNWFSNNWSNNVSFITDEKKSNQNIKKFMMIRVLSINVTESEESTEFVKILN